MLKLDDLRRRLRRIEGKGFKAYQDIQGEYDFQEYVLHVDKVQSDPFAPPSRIRVTLKQDLAGFPEELFANYVRRTALEDYLTRSFARACSRRGERPQGTGNSGVISIDRCGQEILERTSMLVNRDMVQARFVIGLPARGRSIDARQAERIFQEAVPEIVDKALVFSSLDPDKVQTHVDGCEDQHILRSLLPGQGLVAFVGNGSLLPRESGISDHPLAREKTVAFVSPPELEVAFELPHQGLVRGMGIPKGVSLILGGGYHGKSTLLRALERGVYNHIPGDGRDLVVSLDSGVKIRAEDGRSVTGVDIRPFIGNLPFGTDTARFSSDNASGSTSQAANIIEALEAGADLLFLDEDTSATNFMIRDFRMQQLVAKEFEPITPFVDQVRQMYTRLGVSTVLVLGGSGDYFDVADTVIMLREYRPLEVSTRAREVSTRFPSERSREIGKDLSAVRGRRVEPTCFQLKPRDKIRTKGLNLILFGREHVDLFCLEQLVDQSQTRAIAEIFRLLAKEPSRGTLRDLVDSLLAWVDDEGLDCLSPFQGQHPGDLARPRAQEICAAVNRFRRLKAE